MLFEDYPLAASLLVSLGSLGLGAIEAEVVKSKAPAALTWVLGGLASVLPIAESSYPLSMKLILLAVLIPGYVGAIVSIWKKAR
jgi:hypothetical protein